MVTVYFAVAGKVVVGPIVVVAVVEIADCGRVRLVVVAKDSAPIVPTVETGADGGKRYYNGEAAREENLSEQGDGDDGAMIGDGMGAGQQHILVGYVEFVS